MESKHSAFCCKRDTVCQECPATTQRALLTVLAAWCESSSPRLKSSRFEICPKIAYLHVEWCEVFFPRRGGTQRVGAITCKGGMVQVCLICFLPFLRQDELFQ